MKQADLARQLPGWRVDYFKQINSTQDYAKQLVTEQKITQPLLVVADQQTAGHGRYGRQFYSPAKTGIYLSMVVPAVTCPPGLFTISLAVTIGHMLDRVLGGKAQIQFKWVNDIYLNRKKVSGILVEKLAGMLVCGIGINVTTTDFPHDLQAKAGALTRDSSLSRLQLILALVKAVQADLHLYSSGKFLDEYRQRLLGHNCVATLKVNRGLVTGRMKGITNTGKLILQTANGSLVVNSGEVIKVNL